MVSSSGGISVKGLAELDAVLKTLPAKIEGNILRGGIRAGAKVLEDAAKSNLRANGSVDTGALLRSIKLRTRSRKGRVSATVSAGDSVAFYARYVEFGTSAHLIKPRRRSSLFFAGLAREVVEHPGGRAKPFMRPALDGFATQAVEATASYIKRRLTKQGLL